MYQKKQCQFCVDGIQYIDYKDVHRLVNFMTGSAKIVPRYYTGACLNHQKNAARAIKRARFMGLLPFTR